MSSNNTKSNNTKSNNTSKNGNKNGNGNGNKNGISNKMKNSFDNVQKKVKNTYENIKPNIEKSKNTLSNTINETKDKMGKSFDGFKSSSIGQQMTGIMKIVNDFSENNSTIAKIVFVLFMFVLFGLLFRLGVYIISLFFTDNKNPIVLNGMRSTLTKKIYRVNPNEKDSKPILRSINENQGMEFTWSTWLWINSTDYGGDTEPRLFFSKGESVDEFDISQQSVESRFIMNSPGLYLYDKNSGEMTNTLSVVLSFFEETSAESSTSINFYEIISIPNIPMQKWINVIIRIQGKIVDIYINGTLTKRKQYSKVIKQNYGDIFVGSQKYGADAYISSLRYFSYAIGNNTIQDIVFNGPNLKMDGSEMIETKPPYLSSRWYLDEPPPLPSEELE